MKISKCPKCHKESGFLSFRKVQRGNTKYPYVCHYDKKKYALQMEDYLDGKRKSKPNGRTCCSIRIDQAEDLDFEDNWFEKYWKTIKRIHSKYYRYEFMSQIELKEFLNEIPMHARLEKTRQTFVKHKHWKEDWAFCEKLLEKGGYALDPRRKIMKDIYFKIEFGTRNKEYKHGFLHALFLD